MSWSVNLIGTPDKIAAALEEEGGRLADQSKIEFDAVREHIAALVKENFNLPDAPAPLLQLEASGHGMAEAGEQRYRNVAITLRTLYHRLA